MFLSPQLTILSICIISIAIILPSRWVRATTQTGKKNSHYNSIINSFLLNRLQSARLISLSNTAELENNNYSRLTEKFRKLNLALLILKAKTVLTLEPMVVGISLFMFYIAITFLNMQISTILLYMVVMIRIVPIITNILSQKQSMNATVGPMQAIERLSYDMGISITNHKRNIQSQTLINKINTVKELRLENVFFCYKNSLHNSLSKISHTFNKSTLTAVVGPSGSGKTTFVDIISGYRHPSSGDIFIDGVNSKKYSYKAITSLVSYVPQDPQIFDGTTIYDHISYGKQNPTKDDVINASKLSGAYDFIKDLPKGFDTILNGSSLGVSGGQKQKIDLSRALLKDTPVLIMDEPTGNLDSISERDLMLNINNIKKTTSRIIIVIAHRLNTIINSDNIIVMEDGRISDFGKHLELLERNSWYKKANFET